MLLFFVQAFTESECGSFSLGFPKSCKIDEPAKSCFGEVWMSSKTFIGVVATILLEKKYPLWMPRLSLLVTTE